jgi:hypothetical protein
MNLYTVCKPRAFTLGAPTEDNAAKSREEAPKPRPEAPKPRPEAPGWNDFEKGIRDQILEHAAITLTESCVKHFDFTTPPNELWGITTTTADWNDRGLNWLSVKCRCTWIFKRKRKSIEDRTGELKVTIKREVLPEQTCVYWKKMTEEEQNACSRELMYEKTWSHVNSIAMDLHRESDQTYRFVLFAAFYDIPEDRAYIAPAWATWSLTQCANMRTAFEDELLLNYTEAVGTTYNHPHTYQIVLSMTYDI